MLRIAVCDDSKNCLGEFKTVLEKWEQAPTELDIQFFAEGDSLERAHNTEPFDIIFLDIVMPLINGIEVARTIRQNDAVVKIVFLTSSAEFAIDSYSVKANGYLLKPVDAPKLYALLGELAQEIKVKERFITLRVENGARRIEVNRIEYVESQNKQTLFWMVDRESVVCATPLYEVEEWLADTNSFFKCGRSYIVNMRHIDTYTDKEARMISGCRVPISRRVCSRFEKAYFEYFFAANGGID